MNFSLIKLVDYFYKVAQSEAEKREISTQLEEYYSEELEESNSRYDEHIKIFKSYYLNNPKIRPFHNIQYDGNDEYFINYDYIFDVFMYSLDELYNNDRQKFYLLTKEQVLDKFKTNLDNNDYYRYAGSKINDGREGFSPEIVKLLKNHNFTKTKISQLYHSLPISWKNFEAIKLYLKYNLNFDLIKNLNYWKIDFDEAKRLIEFYPKSFWLNQRHSWLYLILARKYDFTEKGLFFLNSDVMSQLWLDYGKIYIFDKEIPPTYFADAVNKSNNSSELYKNLALTANSINFNVKDIVDNLKNANLHEFIKKDYYPIIREAILLHPQSIDIVINILSKLKLKFGINNTKKIFKEILLNYEYEHITAFAAPKDYYYNFALSLIDIYGETVGHKIKKLIKLFDIIHNVYDGDLFGIIINFINNNKHLYKFDFNSNDVINLISGKFIYDTFKLNQEMLKKKLKPEDLTNFITNFGQAKFTKEDLIVAKTIQTIKALQGIDQDLINRAQNKNNKVTSLNYNFNNGFKFETLKEFDFEHFTVGLETDCCQRIGGAGEAAAIDSFINPLAGVLVLRGPRNEIISQSYFHYIPENNSYILDNVESNELRVNKYKLNLEEMYAKLAKYLLASGVTQVLAGKNYSAIDTSYFRTIKLKEDPREFEVDNPYSDFEESDAMDLGTTKFDFKRPKPELLSQQQQQSLYKDQLKYRLEEKYV